MATYQTRGKAIRAIVRRKGHKTQTATFKRKIDAEKWARKLESTIDEGEFVQPIKTLTSVLFLRYREEVSTLKLGHRWEKNRINKLMREAHWMSLPLSDMSGDALQAWKIKRLTEVSGASVDRELNLISSVFSHAIKEWRIKLRANPASTVSRPPKVRHRTRRVAPEETAALWAYFGDKLNSQKAYVPWMFEFAIETGLRLSELGRLRWADVHLAERWIHVLPGKNGDPRATPLTGRAVELLTALPRRGERVFPVNIGSIGCEFRDACTALKITDLHFHDTRHEATSRLCKVFEILELSKVIGHRDLKSLQVYYNPTPQELVQVLIGAALPMPPHPLPTKEGGVPGS